jgi:hypothetical protein
MQPERTRELPGEDEARLDAALAVDPGFLEGVAQVHDELAASVRNDALRRGHGIRGGSLEGPGAVHERRKRGGRGEFFVVHGC